MVEVSGSGPFTLNVTLLEPQTQNLICVQLSVQLGGKIAAQLHTVSPDFRLPFSEGYVASLINACHSIPLMIKHLLHGRYGLGNPNVNANS